MSLATGFDGVAVWLLLAGGWVVLVASIVRFARSWRRTPVGGAASPRTIGGIAVGGLALAAALVMALLGGCGPAQPPTAAVSGSLHEVDYGLVELDQGGAAVAVASFKRGGVIALYPGDEFRYRAIGSEPLPPFELKLGANTIMLDQSAGTVTVAAGDASPQQAVMRALGARVSLPGGAPPRVAVKVEVYSRRNGGR